MRKISYTSIGLFLSLMALASTASATGFGGYLNLESGSGTETAEVDDRNSYETDMNYSGGGLGFTLDNALRDERPVNYRFAIGLDSLTKEYNDADEDSTGIAMTHAWGFGLIRKQKFRVWIGPEIKVGFYAGSEDYGNSSSDWVLLRLGGGPVVGFNFAVARHLVLSVTAGVMYNNVSGFGTISSYYDDVSYTTTDKFSNVFCNLSFFID
ncbi:MAG: hypothetical protein KJ950_08265 [Proteobacteria bacterium]|nr:hypothetical protein [Pseudomonadota bacterium]MBU1686485.1 hypothetical protein [Pseudomonadota bacterium]